MKKQKSKNKILSTKHNNGITLIALIITIVVLLILAVVSIGTIRNSRIITHSQNASNDYTIAQEKEQIQLALNEWQIQKYIPDNNKTFKDVITSELDDVAEKVNGEEEGPLTITMKETQNRYTVTDDGATTSLGKVTELEKHILGENLNGQELYISWSDKKLTVYNSSSEINDDDITVLSRVYIGKGTGSDSNGAYDSRYITYISYNSDVYRFVYEGGESDYSIGSYGLTKVDVPENETRVSKKVSYDGKMWTIIYDNETAGLQMVSDNIILYNSGKFTLNGVNSYNNAITELNTACESLFKENENYENSNIVDVRCVGSNPKNKNDENDTNFINDYDRMLKLGICVVKNTEETQRQYWLSSRVISYFSEDNIQCSNIRYISSNGEVDKKMIKDDEGTPYTVSSYLRPAIKLKSDVVFSGEGTESNPYTF